MQQLMFKSVARSLRSAPSSFPGLTSRLPLAGTPALRVFTSKAQDTGLADVAEILKTNYVVEFDQGLTDD